MQVTTIGLDIAKSVFQVHGLDRQGRVVLRKRLARAKVLTFFANLRRCVIGLEACGGAHHWARELIRLGHDARLMPPQYVKAYVKTNKHAAADAEACCEAVQRPSMRFVAVKTEAQQATSMLHRVRDQLIGQRTAAINALRGHLAAWLGLVPGQRASGGQERRLGISKRGDGYLRRQLIHGARSLVRLAQGRERQPWAWINALLSRRPCNVAVAAVANKLAGSSGQC
jgi:transposase